VFKVKDIIAAGSIRESEQLAKSPHDQQKSQRREASSRHKLQANMSIIRVHLTI